MIVPSDADYIDTKLVKRGERALIPVFKDLADWISASYPGKTVLNIEYDRVTSPAFAFPRLSIILEREGEAKSFHTADGNFDSDPRLSIILEREGEAKSFHTADGNFDSEKRSRQGSKSC